MDRLTPSGTPPLSGNANPNPLSSAATKAKVDDLAQTAHQTVDKVADGATAQVDRLSGSAHRAVNSAADAAGSAADWASTIPGQASKVQTRLTEATCASIRSRPIAAVAGAFVVGYLFARIAGRRTY
jgi:hypothetical protein